MSPTLTRIGMRSLSYPSSSLATATVRCPVFSKTSQHAIRLYHANMDGMTTRPIVMIMLTTLAKRCRKSLLNRVHMLCIAITARCRVPAALRLRRRLVFVFALVGVRHLRIGRVVDDIGVLEMVA